MKKYAPLFVALGAISYGIPGILFKLAQKEGVKNGTLLCFIFLIGCFVLNLARLALPVEKRQVPYKKEKYIVIGSGVSMAVTNTFYLLSLTYIPVSVAAVMMMQSVWMVIFITAIKKRQWPTVRQGLGVCFVLFGTVLATGLFPFKGNLSLEGMVLSFIAALAYALTIQFTGNIGLTLHPLNKTALMSIGTAFFIVLFWGRYAFDPQTLQIGLKWGSITSIFAILFPLTAYAFFMPHVKSSVGAILSSMELPSSLFFAALLLGETITTIQLIGIGFILYAVFSVNLPLHQKKEKHDVV